MRGLGRVVARLLSLVDELVALALLLAGLALTVVVASGDASAVEIGLVLVLTTVVVGWWSYTSNVWDWLTGRD